MVNPIYINGSLLCFFAHCHLLVILLFDLMLVNEITIDLKVYF